MINIDVLVIGAGTAGNYAALAARKTSDSVGIIEKGQVGGDCIFHACMPTKALVHAARTYKKMKTADYFGLPVLERPVEYKNIKAFKNRIIAETVGEGRDKRLNKAGVRLFKGSAKFLSTHEVSVADDVIRAEKIIVTTGSMPAIPPIPGLKEIGYITNIEALELEKVPATLGIIGGGPIGVEFAQIFSSFGAKVRIYETSERTLPTEDEEISRTISGLFEKQGIASITSAKISKVQATQSGKLITFDDSPQHVHAEEVDEILVATGRKPELDGLNPSISGLRINAKGIMVDSFMHTNVPHIWAAGDVTGPPLFTYVAWPQGEAAGANATNREPKEINYKVLPHVTFCDPEVASVGLTEQQARQKGYKVAIGKYDCAKLTLAMLTGEKDGFIKIIADADSGQILGGHILGAEASSSIHEIAAAMAGKTTAYDIGGIMHSYPTFSEGVQYACQSLPAAGKNTVVSVVQGNSL